MTSARFFVLPGCRATSPRTAAHRHAVWRAARATIGLKKSGTANTMIGITTHELAVLGIGMGIAGGLGAAWGVLAWWMRLMAAVAIPTAPFVAIPLFCFAVFVWLLLDAVIFTTGPSTTHPLGQAAAGTFLLSFGIVCYGTLPAVLGGAVSMWACHAIARRRRSTPH